MEHTCPYVIVVLGSAREVFALVEWNAATSAILIDHFNRKLRAIPIFCSPENEQWMVAIPKASELVSTVLFAACGTHISNELASLFMSSLVWLVCNGCLVNFEIPGWWISIGPSSVVSKNILFWCTDEGVEISRGMNNFSTTTYFYIRQEFKGRF